MKTFSSNAPGGAASNQTSSAPDPAQQPACTDANAAEEQQVVRGPILGATTQQPLQSAQSVAGVLSPPAVPLACAAGVAADASGQPQPVVAQPPDVVSLTQQGHAAQPEPAQASTVAPEQMPSVADLSGQASALLAAPPADQAGLASFAIQQTPPSAGR